MALNFSVLASGSTGNAIFVETEEHSFLVDAGLSGKAMEAIVSANWPRYKESFWNFCYT